MLTTHIKELLEVNNRIIVPDLGAFMIRGENDQNLYFNEFLKFNDGVLVDYLAQIKSIDKVEATLLIKKYVEQIKSALQNSKGFELEGIGLLTLDEDGKKILIPGKKGIPDKNNHPGETKENTTLTEPVSIPSTEDINSKIPEPKTSDSASQDFKSEIKSPISSFESERPKANPIVPPSRTSVHETKVHAVTVPKRSKLSRFASKAIWIVPLVLIILMVADYFVFFYHPGEKKSTSIEQPDTLSQKTIKDTLSEEIVNQPLDSGKILIENAKNQKDTIYAVSPSSKLYYLVAGCFKIEINADNFSNKLKKEGYPSEKFAKIGSYHYVSFKSFEKKPPAMLEINKIRSEGKYQTWLIFY